MIGTALRTQDAEPLIRWDWLARHTDDLGESLKEHVFLTLVSLALGLAIALVLAATIRRWRATETPILTTTTVLYAIPSIALFAALIPWFGTGMTVPVIALTTYSLVVLTPFLLTALDEVDPHVLSAAEGLGMTSRQRALRVLVPLALPAIIGGTRVAATTLVGLVTVGGLFGFGGFGNLIDSGLTRDFPTLIIVGIIGSVALALVVDAALALLERRLGRWRAA